VDPGIADTSEEWAHMIRKFAAALVALVIAVGAVFAEEIKGTFVKFADGKLTVKVDDKEKEYKVPSDLKIKRKGKDGTETEVSASDALGKYKEGAKMIIEEEGGTVKSFKRDRSK
jgi:Rieske Fe-S protein